MMTNAATLISRFGVIQLYCIVLYIYKYIYIYIYIYIIIISIYIAYVLSVHSDLRVTTLKVKYKLYK